MKNTPRLVAATALVVALVPSLVGCGEDNDRKPTAAEGAAADAKRQTDIDSLSIPQSAKDAMKSHIGSGGPPTDAAARGGK